MKTEYRVIEGVKKTCDGEEYISFGIAVSEEGAELTRVDDVFLDASAAHDFAALCTELELSKEHFLEAIEDVIAVQ